MASTSPNIKQEASIPFWRDVRVLGIIGQIVVTMLVIVFFAWLINNFVENAENQGLQVGFDFLNSTAAFDIAEGIEYEATDTFGRALWVGVVNTIRVSLIGIVLTTLLGIVVGIARLSSNWLISRIATVYIEIVRNVPLLVLLFFIYFAVILKLPAVRDSAQIFGLPVYLNNRGIAIPGLTATSGFPIWLAFIILGVILVMVLWTIQSRQEEQTGEPRNKLGTAVFAFLIVVFIGWLVTTTFVSDQAIMVSTSKNIQGFDDFEGIYLASLDTNALRESGLSAATVNSLDSTASVGAYQAELKGLLDSGALTPEEAEIVNNRLDILDNGAVTLCSIENSAAEINAASQLRQRHIPVDIKSSDSMRQAGSAYASGDCDILAGTQAELAAERSILEAPDAHELQRVNVPPLVMNTPAPAGFNIQGGLKLSPEFAALLIGLIVYTGSYAAEIVRAGILSVSKGQTEAARALGLNETQRLRLIVLPQAMRVIIPPMTSQYLNLTKNSSLAVAIGYPDLVSVGNTVLNQSGFAVQVIIIFMISYLTISLSISTFLNWYNQKVRLVER
ncbi:MAG: ABC transporter permease subunit [Anaerolineaceae bacterium]|nr:ABC transporter permease subunit [Anaerolineaceae bacterium]MCB9098575.1 ABC transporter permease subunit [Anaerolineales bacterium]